MGIVEDFHAAVGGEQPGFAVPAGMRLTMGSSPANDNEDARTSNGLRAFQGLPTYPDVIALAGPAGSGKSTAARHLIERHGYVLVKFAGPLKQMLRAIGMTDEHIEGSLKEVPSKLLCGKTPRWAMQSLGKEWARDLIGPDLWVNAWYETVADVLDQGGRVVTDDCRYENEAARVRELGGRIFELQGRGGIAGGHSSEGYRPAADTLLMNTQGVDALHRQIDYALAAYDEMARGVVQVEEAA
jgi:hypothetical protein